MDSPVEDLPRLYDELRRVSEIQRNRAMSEEIKKQAEIATEFFKKVQEGAEQFQKTIPDKQLSEKLKKVGENAGEVVKHLVEKTEH